MSLGKKLALFIFLVNFVSIGSIYVFSKLDLQTNTLRLEDAKSQEDMQKLRASLDTRLSSIDVLNADYAGWDDTYNYVQKPNSAYIKSNFVDETFISTGVNFVLILDKDKKILFKKGISLENFLEIPIPADLFEIISSSYTLTTFSTPEEYKTGFLYLDGQITFVSIRPVITSEKNGPVMGTLLMARYLDSEILNELIESTKLDTRIYNIQDLSSDVLQLYNDCLYTNVTCVVRNNSSSLDIYSKLTDLLGNTVGIVKVTTSRELYSQSQTMSIRFMYVMAAVGLFSSIAVMFLIKRIFVKRLERLMHDINKLKDSKDGNLRVRVYGNDELDTLAVYINEMLKNIEGSRNEQTKLTQRLSEEKKNVENLVQERTFALQEEHARLLAAINTSPSAFMVLDLNGNIILKNQLSQDLLHMGDFAGEFGKESLLKAFEGSVDISSLLESCVADSKTHRLNELEWENKVLNMFIAPVKVATVGRVTGVLILISDITDSAIHERSKDEFFSIASHELRTPLTVIKGYVSMLRSRLDGNTQSKDMLEILSHIQLANEKIISIVNNLLTVALLEQNKLTFNIGPLNIIDLMKSEAENFRAQANSKNLVIHVDIPDNISIDVLADKEKVKQVLSIMLKNALKYTSEGGITLRIENISNSVKVFVSDTGSGISEKDQSLLFRKFQQASPDIYTRDTVGGTGLELYIAKLLVDSMKGTISLEKSVVGSGSTFAFTLPKVKS